ncbi:MAG: hypothetical protein QGH63_02885 [Rhodospirillales bacterium]|nr:hypothetical protein [Rhodospirillales bacterium]
MYEDFAWVLDESIADTSMESLPILVLLKILFLKVFMEVFRDEFGDFAKLVLREPEFATIYLTPVVEEFGDFMSGDFNEDQEDSVGTNVELKWRGQKDEIIKW